MGGWIFSSESEYKNVILRKGNTIPYCSQFDAQDNVSSSILFSQVRRWDNPRQSRTMPPKPLWFYPTSLQTQYTETRTVGVVSWENNYQEWCGSGGDAFLTNRSITSYQYDFPKSSVLYSAIPGTDSLTNWAYEMRDAIKDVTVNLGTALVEYRQTASMFSDFAESAHDLYRWARGKARKSRLSACDIASAELTMSYGLLPLAGDLADSVRELQARLDQGLTRRIVITKTDSDSFSNSTIEGKWDASQRAIAYVTVTPKSYGNFTTGNLLELGWEVIPFSFVVDWGIPIGGYLSSLDALKGVESIKGTLTTKVVYEHEEKSPYAGLEYTVPPSVKEVSHGREVLTSIPLPRAPEWEPSRSWKAVMHGLSLLTVLNSRCSKRTPR